MNRRIALLWGVVTVALAAIVAAVAYHVGQTTTIVATAPAGGAVYYPAYGFGFFPFFGLLPLLLIGIILFALFRRPWGRGYWGGGGYDWYGRSGGVPPAIEDRLKEWHHRAHGEGSTTPSSGQSADRPPSA